MGIIEANDLTFEYIRRDEEGNVESINKALNNINLNINKGDFIAILGSNGSGKSTLAKHINAILFPTEGTVFVDGKNTTDIEKLWEIRQEAGMVFQNPDNQIIGNIVEEDVGFGPENMGIPTEEIWERVRAALKAVGMYQHRKHSPNRLSGGQKQRVAIAGVVAMRPKCIILDEATAMLDPVGRKEVLRVARDLRDRDGVTIILITHYMEEVIYADHVFVMDKGEICIEGTPREIFGKENELREHRLCVPQITELAGLLAQNDLPINSAVLTKDELALELKKVLNRKNHPIREFNNDEISSGESINEKPLIIADHLSFIYNGDIDNETKALDDISFTIKKGEFIGLIGHTGSGKSTLVQHLNGLMRPTNGTLYYEGKDIYEKGYDIAKHRFKVGVVFQYPEHQLFEETVFKDVCFGPQNMGLSKKEVELKAFSALKAVKVDDSLFYASPFELSGGQKRRVAIAGILAMDPQVLVLDEPTAGLDPAGRDEIFDLLIDLNKSKGITIVLVSHSMEDVANYVDRLLVMNKGKIIMDGVPRKVFLNCEELERIGLSAPAVTYLFRDLSNAGFSLDMSINTVEEAEIEILRLWQQ